MRAKLEQVTTEVCDAFLSLLRLPFNVMQPAFWHGGGVHMHVVQQRLRRLTGRPRGQGVDVGPAGLTSAMLMLRSNRLVLVDIRRGCRRRMRGVGSGEGANLLTIQRQRSNQNFL